MPVNTVKNIPKAGSGHQAREHGIRREAVFQELNLEADNGRARRGGQAAAETVLGSRLHDAFSHKETGAWSGEHPGDAPLE
jgi:hypothetical protein